MLVQKMINEHVYLCSTCFLFLAFFLHHRLYSYIPNPSPSFTANVLIHEHMARSGLSSSSRGRTARARRAPGKSSFRGLAHWLWSRADSKRGAPCRCGSASGSAGCSNSTKGGCKSDTCLSTDLTLPAVGICRRLLRSTEVGSFRQIDKTNEAS